MPGKVALEHRDLLGRNHRLLNGAGHLDVNVVMLLTLLGHLDLGIVQRRVLGEELLDGNHCLSGCLFVCLIVIVG
ncbi:hypothetical protein MT325_m840L [Paramecium bursaria chlorella virus MT325]|uniref:Uncharacterized protein m004R n=1 Tax=Paramecium bursaria Chlorella virus MT325 TaxID=346932 RepID=A7IT84_PBCVM|nr:hypothetical protein MT325_m004R [Paramecium bursaria chlorella virus MT325]ABT14394.1 hypothetical protein MT325_m840L [Paramecium bursaria chlorella virus MT325]